MEWAKPGADQWHYQRKRIAHSFGKRGPDCVASLVKNNRRFRDLLDVVDQRATTEKSDQIISSLSESRWVQTISAVRTQATSLHAALQIRWNCTCSMLHATSLQLPKIPSETWTHSLVLRLASSPQVPSSTARIRRFHVTTSDGQLEPSASVTASSTRVMDKSGYLEKLQSDMDLRVSDRRELSFYNEHKLVSMRKSSSGCRTGSLKGVLKLGGIDRNINIPADPQKYVRRRSDAYVS